jgi:hypothetical protein
VLNIDCTNEKSKRVSNELTYICSRNTFCWHIPTASFWRLLMDVSESQNDIGTVIRSSQSLIFRLVTHDCCWSSGWSFIYFGLSIFCAPHNTGIHNLRYYLRYYYNLRFASIVMDVMHAGSRDFNSASILLRGAERWQVAASCARQSLDLANQTGVIHFD